MCQVQKVKVSCREPKDVPYDVFCCMSRRAPKDVFQGVISLLTAVLFLMSFHFCSLEFSLSLLNDQLKGSQQDEGGSHQPANQLNCFSTWISPIIPPDVTVPQMSKDVNPWDLTGPMGWLRVGDDFSFPAILCHKPWNKDPGKWTNHYRWWFQRFVHCLTPT